MNDKNKFYKDMTPVRWSILILLIILFVAIPFFDIEIFPGTLALEEDKSIQTLYFSFIIILNFLLVCVTAVLAYVAWKQLSEIGKTAQADFLLRIDERYGGEAIIKARAIIQRLYRESNDLNPNTGDERVHRRHIAKRINEISKDSTSFEEYTYLLNLLDFLETVSYHANSSKLISHEDVKNLMGPSMEFFFKIFILRIRDRRKKYHNGKYYCEFYNLIKKLKNDKKRSKLKAQYRENF